MNHLSELPAVSPLDFLRLLTRDEITVTCAKPPLLEDHPDLPLRIRGALGQVLARIGPPIAHRFDPFGRPRAFAVLFSELPAGYGRPFAIDVDLRDDRLIVRLSLFGDAGFWVDDVREGLLEALGQGIALKLGGRQRVPMEPIAWQQTRTGLDDPPAQCREAVLLFRTPVVVRSGRTLVAAPAAIVESAVERLRGLAAWHGVQLLEAGLPSVAPETASLEEALAVRTLRFSQRQRDLPIEVTGLLGRLRVSGAAALAPILVAGAATHVGSHAALGFGRYELAFYP